MKNINKFMTITPQVKCADSSECFGWHQDCAYADLGPAHKLVTAWVALSDSNEDNGCVRMVSGARYPGLRWIIFVTDSYLQAVTSWASCSIGPSKERRRGTLCWARCGVGDIVRLTTYVTY